MNMEKHSEEIYVSRLMSEYGYPKRDTQKEVAYAYGKARYRFDILVMKEGKPYIIIEVKTMTKRLESYTDQLLNYVRALDVEFAVLTDGYRDKCYTVKRDAYETYLVLIPDIPSYGKSLDSIGTHSNKELIKVKPERIYAVIHDLVDEVRLKLGLTMEEAFEKVLKFLVLKAFNESFEDVLFRATVNEPPENVKTRMKIQIIRAQEKYPTITQDILNIDNDLFKKIIYAFQKYALKASLKEVEGSKLPLDQFFGREAYMHSTPSTLVKLMIDLLEPKQGHNFIDPACGIGGLLIEAASRGLKVTGIELITYVAQIAEANIALSDYEGRVINAESLSILDHTELNLRKNSFDYAAVVPPFGGKIEDNRLNRFVVSTNKRSQNPEVMFLEHTLGFLRNGGKMVIITTQGFLFGDSYFDAREFILKKSRVKAIFTLPIGLFSPFTAMRASLLFLEKTSERGTKSQDQVYVAIIDNAEDFERIISSFREFENTGTVPEDGAFIINLENPKQLNPDYLKGLYRIKKRKESGISPEYPQVQIQNIARLTTGARMSAVGTKNPNGEALYVRAGDVADLLLNLDGRDKITAKGKISQFEAEAGDILMTRAGTVGRVALVQESSLPIILGSNVLKISITDKKRILPEFLLAVLRSKYGQRQIHMFTGGSTIRAISVSGVRQIKVPLPPISEQKKVALQINEFIQEKKKAIKFMEQIKNNEEKMLDKLNQMIGR